MQTLISRAPNSFTAKIIFCLSLVMLVDFLFFDHPFGATLGAFGFILLAVFLLLNPSALQGKQGKIVATIAIFECLLLIEHPSPLRLCLYILSIAALAVAARGHVITNALTFADRVFDFLARSALRPLQDFVKYDNARQHLKKKPVKKAVLIGWVLPFALTLVFLLLFGNANPIIGKWVDAVNLTHILEGLSFGRILFWMLMAALFWAVLRPRIKTSSSQNPAWDMGVINTLFTRDAILRSLVIFNILFAAQNIMDLVYLWGGAGLPDGMGYAQYAQKGAYTLVVTALLSAAFVLIVLKQGREEHAPPLTHTLIYAWVAQNIFLMISSLYRLNLYVEEYSLTYLRFAALIWMLLVAAGLVLIIIRMARAKSNLWLINANGMTLALVLILCSTLNIGSLIAHYNVRHNYEIAGKGQHLDIYYLSLLGPSSLGAIEWLEAQPQWQGYKYDDKARQRFSNIKHGLKTAETRRTQNWRSWTLRVHLNQHRPQ